MFTAMTKLFSHISSQSCKISLNFMRFQSFSEDLHPLKDASLHCIPKGSGGRLSFNGIVAAVFGASGFLGRYVCNKLGKIGTQLIIPYHGTFYEVRRLKLCGDLGQVNFISYKLDEPESIEKCVRHANVVINLVGRDWETKNFKFADVHVKGACDIATATKNAGIETLIHVSALNVSENPTPYMIKGGSKFLASKFAGENAVREIFPNAIIFRPSDMYGQEDRFLRYYNSKWRHQFYAMPLYRKGEETEKQPVFVSDVAAGIVAAAINNKVHRGKIFQAVGPSRYLLSELVDWFHRVTRKDVPWAYFRYNIKYDIYFQLKVSIIPCLSLNWPIGNLHWERLEREAHDDIIDDNPTLCDLGITLTHIEDQIIWELRTYKAKAYYMEEVGEFEFPAPPKKIC